MQLCIMKLAVTINHLVKSNMLIGYLFDNRLLRFIEDSTFFRLRTCAAICVDFWLPLNIWPKLFALTVGPRNKKSEFPLSVLYSLAISIWLSLWNLNWYLDRFWAGFGQIRVQELQVLIFNDLPLCICMLY